METRRPSSEETRADLVITNAKVITVDKDFNIRQAVAVKEGKIVAVGMNDDVKPFIGPDTRVLNLKGNTVMPGINEAHMHGPFFGATRPPLALDLTSSCVRSIRDMVELLRQKVNEAEPGEWIRGFGWDLGSLEECKNDPTRLPRKSDIDSVSMNNPVIFTDFSSHTLLTNSKTLELAGITKDTPNPQTGEMERDPVTGEPSGIFKELGGQGMIAGVVPLLTREEKKQALITTLDHLKRNGVTSYTDAAIGPGGEGFVSGVMSAEFIDIYEELLKEGNLTARVNVLLLFGEYGALTLEDLRRNIESFRVPADVDKAWLSFPGIKIFADGIPPTMTAWMNEDYMSGGHGTSVLPGKTDQEQRDKLIEMITYVHSKGYQVGVHATGDRAIDAAVDGFVRACEKVSGGDPRHYIIHGDFISQEKAKALARINCGIAMQPYIKVMISDYVPAIIGGERAAYEWPARTVLNAGANLTSSSDAPVTYPNWRLGVQAALLREGLGSGKVSGPEECISVEEAIRTYTINGAWQDHMEDVKGSIEVGKFADLCVIGEDILTVDSHKIGEIPMLMTIVGGRIVFDKEG
jgi:predicted amidohydrolase YtcJ